MVQTDYATLVDRISRASSLPKEDIERRVEAKRAKLSGLVSREGAAQIVAAELGINFEKQKVKINELGTMKRANFSGKVVKIFPVREYKKENREGKVANMVVADETGNIRVVLWDVNHIRMIENNEIKENDSIEVTNGGMRNGEVHLTGFSDIKISAERFESVNMERNFAEKKLAEIKTGESARFRAFIVQVFPPRFFDVCPECSGKVVADVDGSVCEKHGRVIGSKRALLNVVLDDGTENSRAVLFSEQIGKIGLNLEETFDTAKKSILGKEMFFSGSMRQNKFFNNNEFFINDSEELDLDRVIAGLEKR